MKHFLVLSAVLLGSIATRVSAEDKVDFEKQIQPIFAQHCSGCHGEQKAAAKMRLHTAAALKEKWDADKDLIVPGEPEKSELYERLTLPADDKKRMPQKADPLSKELIDLIGQWIKQGAVLPVAAASAAREAPAETKETTSVEVTKQDELPLPEVAPAPQESIDALTKAGAQVMPLFSGSSLLTVSFAHRGEPPTDAEVALLSGVAQQVYALNLTGAKMTDAGLAPLSGLKNLSVLHLERSEVTDAGLAHLAGLDSLQYLNLYGTAITDEGLKHLTGLKHLRRLYLWQTKVTYDAAMELEKSTPGLMVNLGHDHPVVMKMRLTKELEQLKKQAEEAKAEQTKAEQQLEAAKKNTEATNARLTEVEKQLKELESPPAETGDSSQPTNEQGAKPADGETQAKPAEQHN